MTSLESLIKEKIESGNFYEAFGYINGSIESKLNSIPELRLLLELGVIACCKKVSFLTGVEKDRAQHDMDSWLFRIWEIMQDSSNYLAKENFVKHTAVAGLLGNLLASHELLSCEKLKQFFDTTEKFANIDVSFQVDNTKKKGKKDIKLLEAQILNFIESGQLVEARMFVKANIEMRSIPAERRILLELGVLVCLSDGVPLHNVDKYKNDMESWISQLWGLIKGSGDFTAKGNFVKHSKVAEKLGDCLERDKMLDNQGLKEWFVATKKIVSTVEGKTRVQGKIEEFEKKAREAKGKDEFEMESWMKNEPTGSKKGKKKKGGKRKRQINEVGVEGEMGPRIEEIEERQGNEIEEDSIEREEVGPRIEEIEERQGNEIEEDTIEREEVGPRIEEIEERQGNEIEEDTIEREEVTQVNEAENVDRPSDEMHEPALTYADITAGRFESTAPIYPANYVPLYQIIGTPVESLCYPLFPDFDNVPYYTTSFRLTDWLFDKKSRNDRWLNEYDTWSAHNKVIFGDLFAKFCMKWKGMRLNRESLLIMQALVTGFMEYIELRGIHGSLTKESFEIFQLPPINCGGVRKITFKAVIKPPLQVMQGATISNDVDQVLTILKEFTIDGVLDHDLEALIHLLSRYSSSSLTQDVISSLSESRALLLNHSGLWDGVERASFLLQFFSAYNYDSKKKTLLQRAVMFDNMDWINYNWPEIIPEGTIYHDTLTHSPDLPKPSTSAPQTPQIPAPLSKKYGPSKMEAFRYARALLFHVLEKDPNADLREMRWCWLKCSHALSCQYIVECATIKFSFEV